MSEENGGEVQDFTPPASQEELNRIIGERLDRERKKFSDYDDLKAKASQFDALQESKKTDEQKWQERVTTLEQKLTQETVAATKSRIQAKYGLSDADAELFLTAASEEGVEAQAKALADRNSETKKQPPYVPSQRGGEKQEVTLDPLRQMAQNLFK